MDGNDPNKINSHLVTIAPMASFTPKSTSKLKSALVFGNHPTLHCPSLILFKPNNHYNNGFHNSHDYNFFIYSAFLLCTLTASAHIIC